MTETFFGDDVPIDNRNVWVESAEIESDGGGTTATIRVRRTRGRLLDGPPPVTDLPQDIREGLEKWLSSEQDTKDQTYRSR